MQILNYDLETLVNSYISSVENSANNATNLYTAG